MSWDYRFNFEAIGTAWVIEFSGVDKPKSDYLLAKIQKEISEFSSFFSRFDKNSRIWKLSEVGGSLDIPEKYIPLIDLYQDLYQSTGGLFTPLIGNLLSDTGYDADYSLKPKSLKPVLDWDQVLQYNPPSLNLKQPWLLDFGAAGKGFIVDLIGNLLDENGIKTYCIDAGGDILYKDKEKLKVGLEHPENFKQVIGVVEIENESICGSSGNRRKWRGYHHILNPKKLDSVKDVLAVWVIAKTAILADGLSTCLFFADPESLSKYNFEYFIIYPDLSFKKSKNFPGQMYE